MAEVAFDYTWDRVEYIRVVRRRALSRISRWGWLGTPPMFAIAIYYSLHSNKSLAYLGWFVAIASVLSDFRNLWWEPRSWWSAQISFYRPIHVVASNEALVFTTVSAQTSILWSGSERTGEWPGYYFLKRSGNSMLAIIPRRAFRTPEAESIFRDLLRTKTTTQLLAQPEIGAATSDM